VNDLLAVFWIARKDLLHETRSKATTVATLFFSAITLVVLAFAIGQDEALLRGAAAGALWVALAFAGVISAAQSYQADLEDGAFDHLLTTPVPRAAVYLGQAPGQLVVHAGARAAHAPGHLRALRRRHGRRRGRG
jgi:heme exporter protein B